MLVFMTTWHMYPDDRRQAHVDAVMKDDQMRKEVLAEKNRAGASLGYLAARLKVEPATGAQFDVHQSGPQEPIDPLGA